MPRRTGYQPLIDHLAARTEPTVWLTFAEIEQLIGGALPPSARAKASFWTRTGNVHVRGWRALGWRAHFDRRRSFVIFTRDTEVQDDDEPTSEMAPAGRPHPPQGARGRRWDDLCR